MSDDNRLKIWNVPNYNKCFTGRDDFLQLIKDNFKNNNSVVTIVGMPGSGKTQVAKQYAYNNNDHYDIIWWIDASKNINVQYRILASSLNKFYKDEDKIPIHASSEVINDSVKERLSKTHLRWLLIFDNANSDSSIREFIPDRDPKNTTKIGQILITSKHSLAWNNMIKLEKFKREESIEYLTKAMPNQNIELINKLADKLGDYPLALAQSSAYLSTNFSMSIDNYIELLDSKRAILWNKEKEVKEINNNSAGLDNYRETVFNAIGIGVNDIKKQSQNAYDLLVFCSLINNERIPESLLRAYLSKFERLDNLEFSDAISKLMSYSIINQDKIGYEKNNEEDIYYSVHPISQSVVLDSLSEKEKIEYIKKSLLVISEILPDQIEELMPFIINKLSLLAHTKEIINHADNFNIIDESYLTICLRKLEYYLLGIVDYDHAEKFITSIETHFKKKINISNKFMAQLFHVEAAHSSWKNGDQKKAITHSNTALKYLDEDHVMPRSISELDVFLAKNQDKLISSVMNTNNMHSYKKTLTMHKKRSEINVANDYLNIYLRLSWFYIYLGDIENANKYVLLSEKIIKESKPTLKESLYHTVKAKIEMDKGNYEAALSHADKSIEIEKSMNIKDYIYSEADLYLLQAEILLKMGRYQESYDKSSRLNDDMKKYYQGYHHELQARILIILSSASLNLGKPILAKEYITRSIDILQKTYGSDNNNLDFANSLVIMGDVYAYEKNHFKAKEYYQKAELIYYKALEKLRIDDISYLYYKLAINGADLKNNFQMEHYIAEHREYFGATHPRTKAIIDYFAGAGMMLFI